MCIWVLDWRRSTMAHFCNPLWCCFFFIYLMQFPFFQKKKLQVAFKFFVSGLKIVTFLYNWCRLISSLLHVTFLIVATWFFHLHPDISLYNFICFMLFTILVELLSARVCREKKVQERRWGIEIDSLCILFFFFLSVCVWLRTKFV